MSIQFLGALKQKKKLISVAVDCQVSDLLFSSPEPLAHGESDRWMSVVSCVSCILCRQQLTGPRSAVSHVSGNRCESLQIHGLRVRSRSSPTFVEIDHEIISMVILLPQEGLLSVTSESVFRKYWLTASCAYPGTFFREDPGQSGKKSFDNVFF